MNVVFNDVVELHSGKETWKVMVKVIRIWYSQGFTNSRLAHSMEMVLMDPKGTKIHATVKKTLMYKFEKSLLDGNVYSLSGFVLVDSFGDYKTTKHNYKISFMFKTEVRPMNQFPIEVFPYTFVSLAEIIVLDFDTNFLVDVIGIMTGVGVEREIVTQGRRSKMNLIEIEASGVSIECALFGSYVDELTNFLAGGDINNHVVIIQFAKVKSFQGNRSLQNVHGATKILFELDVPMVDVLKTSHVEASPYASRTLSQLSETKSAAGEEEFLAMSASKTISELKQTKKGGVCVVHATICSLEEGVDWWYTTCKCKKKVYADEKMYFCEGCNRHVVGVYPRYRLQVRVQDLNASAIFVLFDKEDSLLIGKTCSELVDGVGKDAGDKLIPDEITRLYGTCTLFKVEVNHSSYQMFDMSRFEPSYREKVLIPRMDLVPSILDYHSSLLGDNFRFPYVLQ